MEYGYTDYQLYSISSVIQCGFGRHILKITTVFDRKTFQHKSIVFITLFHIFDYIEIGEKKWEKKKKLVRHKTFANVIDFLCIRCIRQHKKMCIDWVSYSHLHSISTMVYSYFYCFKFYGLRPTPSAVCIRKCNFSLRIFQF